MQVRGHKICGIFLAVLFLLLSLTLCAIAQTEQAELNYRLKWLFNVGAAGDIYADAAGHFAAQGLKVNILEGSPEKNAINELELGRSDFGVASADQVIRALDKGAHLVVLAQLFQVNPMQWIYRANLPEIKTLTNLKGRKIGITFGGNDETIMNTLLAKAGLSKDDVQLSGVRFDFSPFLQRKVEIWPVYRNTQGVILKDKLAQEGEEVQFLNPAQFEVNFVANSVITSEAMMNKHPETVDKFLAALLQGWQAVMDKANEDKVLAAVKKLDKNTDETTMRKQLAATRELVQPAASVKIGAIDTEAWKQTEKIMIQEGQIKKTVEVEKYLKIKKGGS